MKTADSLVESPAPALTQIKVSLSDDRDPDMDHEDYVAPIYDILKSLGAEADADFVHDADQDGEFLAVSCRPDVANEAKLKIEDAGFTVL